MGYLVATRKRIVADLTRFRENVEYASGHAHLYGPFDRVLADLGDFRSQKGVLDEELAGAILTTVDLLVKENSVGRRPWTGGWEMYFAKCMDDAYRLLTEFSEFAEYSEFCPPGYCNQFLTAFTHMDHNAQHYEVSHQHWSQHFQKLAALAAGMFSAVADEQSRIQESLLEHPDDAIFTHLLTGYAKSRAGRAKDLLSEYLRDEEEWVRRLARRLLNVYFCT